MVVANTSGTVIGQSVLTVDMKLMCVVVVFFFALAALLLCVDVE